MQNIFLKIDNDTSLEELEKIVKYNIGRANILRDSIKELDKVELQKKEHVPKKVIKHEQIKFESEEDSEQEEYLYYYYNMQEELAKATNSDQVLEVVINTLPSCEHKKYLNIVSRIKLELLKEIHELDILSEEIDLKEDKDFLKEINIEKTKLFEVIRTVNYVQNNKKEEQVENSIDMNNKLIFLETPTGSIYAENDLYSIPEEYYESFKDLMLSIKNGTFRNVKMLNNNNQTLGGISEVKDFKTRIVFDRIGTDIYVIISIFTKKCDNDSLYRDSLVNRVDFYKKNKPYLIEMSHSEEFISKNRDIETGLLKGLEEKNLVKTLKGGNNHGK